MPGSSKVVKDYQKQFKKAKTQAEKIAICRDAGFDPEFTPCLPASMDYHAADHQNGGRGAGILDVDRNLINGEDPFVINDDQIASLKKAKITEVYLFSSMKYRDTDRLALIAYLAFSGITVKGVIAQADAAPSSQLGETYQAYYAYKQLEHASEPKKTKPDSKKEKQKEEQLNQIRADLKNRFAENLKKEQDPIDDEKLLEQIRNDIETRFDESEAIRYQYFQSGAPAYSLEHENTARLYGAKTQMFDVFLKMNETLSTIWSFDDAGENLLGMIKILSDRKREGLYPDIYLHTCLTHPVEIKKEYTWNDNYNDYISNITKKQKKQNIGELTAQEHASVLLELMGDALKNMLKPRLAAQESIHKSLPHEKLTEYIETYKHQKSNQFDLGNIRGLLLALLDHVSRNKKIDDALTNYSKLEIIATSYNMLAQLFNGEPVNLLQFTRENSPELAKTLIEERDLQARTRIAKMEKAREEMEKEKAGASLVAPGAGTLFQRSSSSQQPSPSPSPSRETPKPPK